MKTKDDILAQVSKLLTEQAELYAELGRSLLIEKLWPDAFKGDGKVTTVVKGNPRTGLIFTVTFADGSQAHMDLKLAPFELWGRQVQEDVRACGLASPYYQTYRQAMKAIREAQDV